MTVFEITAVLLTITALFGYVNERFIKLPTTIGVTLVALILSLGLLLFSGPELSSWANQFLSRLNFDALVLDGMLSFLLFAGSLTVNLEDLNKQKVPVLILATVGIVTSTFVVGGMTFFLLKLLGLELSFLYCLLGFNRWASG